MGNLPQVRLLPGVAEGWPGHRVPHPLRGGVRRRDGPARRHAEAQLHAHPHVLQLAGHGQGPGAMPGEAGIAAGTNFSFFLQNKMRGFKSAMFVGARLVHTVVWTMLFSPPNGL